MKNYLHHFTKQEKKPLIGLKDLSRLAASEGIVMLKNERNVLPLFDQKISVFGRIQTDYYKSGTGSGGLVNVDHVTSIIDALLENPFVKVNDELLDMYRSWEEEHPYNAGSGFWASEPWSQVEMPLTSDIVKKAKAHSDVAIIVIGRTAGEDKDNSNTEGSYLLSRGEEDMLKLVTSVFDKTVVLLNTGNIMDMSFMDRYPISSILYLWHGGQEGGRAAADVLTGLITPSGKLPDTIAHHLSDYPSHNSFGGHDENIYYEDIYVGYRYFSTFNKQAVRYPFGFGLSYTTFTYKLDEVKIDDTYHVKVTVTNQGKYQGKDVVQLYVKQPQGVLGKPDRVLVGFEKTRVLKPGESESLLFTFTDYDIASYDEEGKTGHPSSYVLEQGTYRIYPSTDVMSPFACHHFEVTENRLVQKLSEALRPKKAFKRIRPTVHEGILVYSEEDVPVRTIQPEDKMIKNQPKLLVTKKTNVTLSDVYQKKATLDEFIAQMSPVELSEIVRGEGMSSPKVTPGTASAFGAVTEDLATLGLPILSCADGPSGIRMDSGMQASSMPNGTCLAASMNKDLVESLYYGVGIEMLNYHIDILLGPGMNLHRHPLCGRNFEYFSEDPLLTGFMGASVVKGLQRAGVTGTVKHFALNNQEYRRFDSDSIASERAIREIYLKGFEIAIKQAKAKAIMTSYNPINGIWAASNYDLNTVVAREEWGFDGIIMTDWWAKMNDDGKEGSRSNTKAMIKAQNDLYMVVVNAKGNSLKDNTMEAFDKKELSLAEMQRVAKNIVRFILDSRMYKEKMNETVRENAPIYDLPIIEKVYLNGLLFESFDPLVSHYSLEIADHFNLTFEVESHASYAVKHNAHTVIVSLLKEGMKNIYVFTNRKRHQNQVTFNFNIVPTDHATKVSTEPWGRTELNPLEPSYRNQNLQVLNDHLLFNKEGIASFAIEVDLYGKYIIELSIASDGSPLAQIPFSIVKDDLVLSTLTTNGTEGKWVDISSQVRLTPGIHRLSLVAKASGLKVKRLHLIRHH
ncbi:MAG: beta-glucosidase [Acholeplasma sp.]|jgi:beta-glucosidase|nr:MAG: beta-glucosidase [Acholeplasma sp.]